MAEGEDRRRCGFIAIVGAPNAGKSTLLNALVGAKVSIVSPKVQTTRSRVLGIAVEGNAQLVYVDTPGIFSAPKRRLERAMVQAAWQGARDADVTLVLVDARRGVTEEVDRIAGHVDELGNVAILVLNKIDLVKRTALLALAAQLNGRAAFDETFMISALNGDGVDDVRRHLAARLPAAEWLFPEDQLSDMPQRLLAAEITREQVFLQLHQELPYDVAVETESWEAFEDGSIRVGQIVYVRRESQKGIVLGKGGGRIKKIGEAARAELAAMLDAEVHLVVHVKVQPNWIDDPDRYRDLGLEHGA